MTFLPAAVAALTLAMPPQSQPTGEALLAGLFEKVEEAVRTQHNIDPVEEVGGMHQLALGETGDLVFDLQGGSYMIVGVCDENCSDIDIVLTTIDGALVGEDTLDDDRPVVTFEAAPGAGYHAKIAMTGCQVAKCRTRAKVYRLG